MIEEPVLTWAHYKEPLLKIPKKVGHGFYGCLLGTEDGEKVQCHICGKLYQGLNMHVTQAHHVSIDAYRETFKLTFQTALVSEKYRQRLKEICLNIVKTTKEKYGDDFYIKNCIRNAKKRIPRKFKIRLETKNKRGTCPDQLLFKIKEVADKLGHTPSLLEFMDETGGQRFKHLIFTTFGSWLNALKMLKMAPVTPNREGTRPKQNYSNEELLEYIRIYAEENRKIPTDSDCKRGILPSTDTYIRHFGGLAKARELAHINHFLD